MWRRALEPTERHLLSHFGFSDGFVSELDSIARRSWWVPIQRLTLTLPHYVLIAICMTAGYFIGERQLIGLGLLIGLCAPYFALWVLLARDRIAEPQSAGARTVIRLVISHWKSGMGASESLEKRLSRFAIAASGGCSAYELPMR
jgi:hypothetical protein